MPKLMTSDREQKKEFMSNTLDTLQQRLSEQPLHYIETTSISVDMEFQSVFPIQEHVYVSIMARMKDHGYDHTYPILVWSETSLLLDGHTRLRAAKMLKIQQIPVIFINVKDREEALQIIYRTQFNRRNLKSSDIIQFLDHYLRSLDEKPPHLRQILGKILNVSEVTVQKYLTLLENRDCPAFTKLMQNAITVSRAYSLLKKKPKLQEKAELEAQIDEKVQDFSRKIETLTDTEKKTLKPIIQEAITLIQMYPKQNRKLVAKLLWPLFHVDVPTQKKKPFQHHSSDKFL